MCDLPYALYHWEIRTSSRGEIYATGRLGCASGKDWVTSDIVKLETFADHYRIQTCNNMYALFW